MARKGSLPVTLPEKDEERLADKTAAMLGFDVVRFSQPRATKQTPGIPDRLYCHRVRGVAVWAELKAANGRVSAHQHAMHRTLRDCGHRVIVGTAEVVTKDLVAALTETLSGGRADA